MGEDMVSVRLGVEVACWVSSDRDLWSASIFNLPQLLVTEEHEVTFSDAVTGRMK